ncbi:hypothetical protein D9M70_525900 [compost metagenome]
MARREINRIDDQRVIARREIGKERHRYGSQARGYKNRPGGTFKFVDRVAKRIRGRRSARPVGVLLRARFHRLRIRKQHGGRMYHGRVDEAEIVGGIVAAMSETGVDARLAIHIAAVCHCMFRF